jgi:hypothetical protein
MNKNKSRKNRVTHKRKNHKKINRTRKGGMPKQKTGSTAKSIRYEPYTNTIYPYTRSYTRSKAQSIQLVNPDNTSSHAATGVSNWFDFLLDDIPKDIPKEVVTTAMAACTTPTFIDNTSECKTPIGYKYMTMNKTPDTKDVIVGTSLVNFADIIKKYLKKKILNISTKTRYMLMKDLHANEIFTSVNINNYYITFLKYLEYVKKFRIYYIKNDTRKNKLDDYFNKIRSLNDVDSFNRKDFFEFVKTILPQQFEYDLGDKLKSLRIDYTGKTLAEITQQQTITMGETYIPYFGENTNPSILCSNDEKAWVFECINKRNNNYISTFDTSKGKWSTLGKNTSPTLEKKITYININKSRYSLKKQRCGTCWICKKEIYHYYIYRTLSTTDDKEQRIYLNTKCGEDEHVFPPTIGDIIGTLNMDAKITRGAIDQYGTHTLLSYGIRPSHAFCNQMKSDFLLFALMNLDTETNIDNYIENKWKLTVNHWFKKERYHSLEDIKQIFEIENIPTTSPTRHDIMNESVGSSTSIVNTSNMSIGTNTKTSAASKYYRITLENMRSYLNTNIAPLILEQAASGQSNVGNMLKLKILIYIIQIGKNIIGRPFLDTWGKN